MSNFVEKDCSLILIDLSGFTQLTYQASFQQKSLEKVMAKVIDFFEQSAKIVSEEGIFLINHTGDGFIAAVESKNPTRTALTFIKRIREELWSKTRDQIHSFPFRIKVDLRTALHHGKVFHAQVPGFMGESLFFGDDINVLARVINSQTARRHGDAITRSAYRRLTLSKTEPVPDEVIIDRNKYPEPIEVFRIPKEILE